MKKIFRKYSLLAVIGITFLFVMCSELEAARIKDIATIEGVSGVQAIGYGLVTGLNNTGDNQRASFTVQSVSNMLKRFGLTIPQSDPRIRNVAAVMVTATVPSFLRKGSKVDVQVSSIGDATSLQGGVLVLSPMLLSNGETFIGMAQGALSVGGYDFQALGSRVAKNFVTSGRIPNGLILDKEIKADFIQNNIFNIVLRDPDFTTTQNITKAVTGIGGGITVTPLNAGVVQVQLPAGQTQVQIMQLISQIESLTVESDPIARVVINERTGTIVIGGKVQLLPAVIAHSGLEIQIQKQIVYPLLPPSIINLGSPKPSELTVINTQEEVNPALTLQVAGATPTVQDIANALNALKVKPRDLISIFQALKESGSLQGELIIQ